MSIAAILGLLGSPLARWGLVAAGLAAALAWYTLRVRRRARAALATEIAAAAAAETGRRRLAIEDARIAAEQDAARNAEAEGRNAERITEIDRASAARDGDPGLPAGSVGRLRDLR